MLRSLVAAILLVLTVIASAKAAEPIGHLARLQGEATVERGGGARPLALEAPVFQGDVVATGRGARAELSLADGTKVTLGENARLTLDSFVYDPARADNSMRIGVEGAFRFISGALATSPARQARIRTSAATLGIRGTDFWSGPIDNRFGVLLLEGAVRVDTLDGDVLLDQAGLGTMLDGYGAPPGDPQSWARDKVERALAQTAFR